MPPPAPVSRRPRTTAATARRAGRAATPPAVRSGCANCRPRPVPCPARPAWWPAATRAMAGASRPPRPAGAPCDPKNSCISEAVCDAQGACVGTPASNGDPCTAEGGQIGQCVSSSCVARSGNGVTPPPPPRPMPGSTPREPRARRSTTSPPPPQKSGCTVAGGLGSAPAETRRLGLAAGPRPRPGPAPLPPPTRRPALGPAGPSPSPRPAAGEGWDRVRSHFRASIPLTPTLSPTQRGERESEGATPLAMNREPFAERSQRSPRGRPCLVWRWRVRSAGLKDYVLALETASDAAAAARPAGPDHCRARRPRAPAQHLLAHGIRGRAQAAQEPALRGPGPRWPAAHPGRDHSCHAAEEGGPGAGRARDSPPRRSRPTPLRNTLAGDAGEDYLQGVDSAAEAVLAICPKPSGSR